MSERQNPLKDARRALVEVPRKSGVPAASPSARGSGGGGMLKIVINSYIAIIAFHSDDSYQ